jgi:predicted PurR-regulated permease PerM
MSDEDEVPTEIRDEMDAQTVALRIIAGLLVVGAMSLLASLLVPFALALILAIALSPLARRLEGIGAPRALAALACTLFVAIVLAGAAGLLAYQAGAIVRDANKYLKSFGTMLARASKSTGGDQMLESLDYTPSRDKGEDTSSDRGEASDEGQAEGRGGTWRDAAAYWDDFVRRNARSLGGWLVSGVGGLLGLLGGAVLLLAYLFYMLSTRAEWIDRVRRSSKHLGLRPSREAMERVQHETVVYLGCLSLVALGYAIVVSLVMWAVGLPQPVLWGVLAGLLEFVPYFGPLIASALPTLVALSLGGGWWKVAVVVGFFIGLHTVEGYVVTPMLYGKAIRIDPVTILVGVLFFGWVWGPLGLTVAMPMLILLRGLVAITPATPALKALVNAEAAGELVGARG